MTLVPPGPAASLPERIASALHALGSEKEDKPETSEAARSARVLLETLNIETLLQTLPSLWAREEAQHRRRRMRLFYFVAAFLLLLTVVMILTDMGFIPERLGSKANALMFFVVPVSLSTVRSLMTPTQTGVIRLLHLRPHARMVPLLIDALGVTTTAPIFAQPVVKKGESRALITRLLPLWCEQDQDDLTLAQQRILLTEIKEITNGGNIFTRPVGYPQAALTLADADFALAAIAALRHCRADRHARRVLSHLPRPVSVDDPRHEVRLAAETYLVQGRQ